MSKFFSSKPEYYSLQNKKFKCNQSGGHDAHRPTRKWNTKAQTQNNDFQIIALNN